MEVISYVLPQSWNFVLRSTDCQFSAVPYTAIKKVKSEYLGHYMIWYISYCIISYHISYRMSYIISYISYHIYHIIYIMYHVPYRISYHISYIILVYHISYHVWYLYKFLLICKLQALAAVELTSPFLWHLAPDVLVLSVRRFGIFFVIPLF